MSKKILIFYLLWIFLINVNFVMAYHGNKISGASASPLTAVLIIIGTIVLFIFIIWFFRKASKEIGKKKK